MSEMIPGDVELANSTSGGDLKYSSLLDSRVDKSSRNLYARNGLSRQASNNSQGSTGSWTSKTIQRIRSRKSHRANPIESIKPPTTRRNSSVSFVSSVEDQEIVPTSNRQRGRSSSQGSLPSYGTQSSQQERSTQIRARSKSLSVENALLHPVRDLMDVSHLQLEKVFLAVQTGVQPKPMPISGNLLSAIHRARTSSPVFSGANIVTAIMSSSFADTELQAVLLAVLLLRGQYIERVSRQSMFKSWVQREARFSASPSSYYRFPQSKKQGNSQWVLLVHVNGARNLDASASRTRGGLPNPVLKATIGSQVTVSKTRKYTTHPKWTIDVLFVIGEEDDLVLSIYDMQFPSMKNCMIGTTKIQLSQLFLDLDSTTTRPRADSCEGRLDLCRWYPLCAESGSPTGGELLISLSLLNRDVINNSQHVEPTEKPTPRRPRVQSVEERVSKHLDVSRVLSNTNRHLTRTNMLSRLYHSMKGVKASANVSGHNIGRGVSNLFWVGTQLSSAAVAKHATLNTSAQMYPKARRYLTFTLPKSSNSVILRLNSCSDEIVVEQVQTLTRVDAQVIVMQIDFVAKDTMALQTVHMLLEPGKIPNSTQVCVSSSEFGVVDGQHFSRVVQKSELIASRNAQHADIHENDFVSEIFGDWQPQEQVSGDSNELCEPLKHVLVMRQVANCTPTELTRCMVWSETMNACSFLLQLKEDGHKVLGIEPWQLLNKSRKAPDLNRFQTELAQLRERIQTEQKTKPSSQFRKVSHSWVECAMVLLLFGLAGTYTEWVPLVLETILSCGTTWFHEPEIRIPAT